MDPPSYDEANLHPPALNTVALSITPPPTYDASLASPSTPPPTYGEAVTVVTDPYPMLTLPTMMTPVTSQRPQTGYFVHQTTQINVQERVERSRHQGVVVVQPQSVGVLGDSPAAIRCPYCQQFVTTKVRYKPGGAAWCMCVLFIVVGLICGCCLIPFLVHGMQDVHHSCPQCRNHLYIHKR